jgi:uncharacterized Rmd1/YagE family protein
MKGNIIILNPYIPSIKSSQVAFSYGIGRAAKLSSIEQSITALSNQLNDMTFSLMHDTKVTLSSRSSVLFQLFSIQQRMFQGSCDGLLGTNDLHWEKQELEGKT